MKKTEKMKNYRKTGTGRGGDVRSQNREKGAEKIPKVSKKGFCKFPKKVKVDFPSSLT